MPTPAAFGLFFSAACILAITPGPGIFYVLARSLKGGRRDGLASSFGTAVGGFGHVLAAALGLSALLATSAIAFSIVKYAGAAYLVYLGVRTLLSRDDDDHAISIRQESTQRVFLQGVLTEVLNPKTALFFLAFIPQFINPHGSIMTQFIVLGSVSVVLNTVADLVVVLFAGPIEQRLRERSGFRRGQRFFTGGALILLGTYVAVADDAR